MDKNFLLTEQGKVKVLGQMFSMAHFNHELIFDDGSKITIGCLDWEKSPEFCKYVNYGVRSVSNGYNATKYCIAEVPNDLEPDCKYVQKIRGNRGEVLNLNLRGLEDISNMRENGNTITHLWEYISKEKIYAAYMNMETGEIYDIFLKEMDGTEELETQWVKKYV